MLFRSSMCVCVSVSESVVKMVKPDIHTLAHHLKQERLYVASEKQLIQKLNGDVLKTAERLYRAAWIAKRQRINLDRLILTRYTHTHTRMHTHVTHTRAPHLWKR